MGGHERERRYWTARIFAWPVGYCGENDRERQNGSIDKNYDSSEYFCRFFMYTECDLKAAGPYGG